MMPFSKHELKKLRKQFASPDEVDRFIRKQRLKSVGTTAGFVIILILFLGGFIYAVINRPTPYTDSPVHWHMPLSYNLCGDTTSLKEIENHGSIIHGHNDKLIHIEGQIMQPSDITLGKFFASAGITFDQDRIGNYKNGDPCPGSDAPGKVTVLIDGKENTEFREHVLKDGEKIEVTFK